ncbi:MAG TPA: hypothetical protein DHM44_02425 [Flexistipes sinusarabici]|uniref:Selenoprotein n=1 Tax=Flexistipes sinusarabici TaxID=2352 RepID=A0A3D5Q9L3_FLESI|nr:hypothetical protein [Flexistipes sinusarabici]
MDVETEISPGPKKSEFAVLVDDKLLFSRLKEKKYPEAEDIIEIIKAMK